MRDTIGNVFATAIFGIGCALLAVGAARCSSIAFNGIQLKHVLCGLLIVGALSSFWRAISAFRG